MFLKQFIAQNLLNFGGDVHKLFGSKTNQIETFAIQTFYMFIITLLTECCQVN